MAHYFTFTVKLGFVCVSLRKSKIGVLLVKEW